MTDLHIERRSIEDAAGYALDQVDQLLADADRSPENGTKAALLLIPVVEALLAELAQATRDTVASNTYSPILAALDRCEHGRHAADRCYNCLDGWSTGNLFLAPGTRIGTNLYGEPIVAPENLDQQRSSPQHWVPTAKHGWNPVK